MKTWAETEVMLPQAQQHQHPSEAANGQEGSDIQPKNYGRINFCCFNPSHLCYIVRAALETNSSVFIFLGERQSCIMSEIRNLSQAELVFECLGITSPSLAFLICDTLGAICERVMTLFTYCDWHSARARRTVTTASMALDRIRWAVVCGRCPLPCASVCVAGCSFKVAG